MPVISDVVIRVVDEGIVIEWDFLHNGGLDILAVEILLRQDSSGPYQPVQGGNLSQPLTNTFLIAGRFLQAGQRYQAAVSVTNAVGRSELVDTESQESPVGMWSWVGHQQQKSYALLSGHEESPLGCCQL